MNACDRCQRMNKKLKTSSAEVHPIPVKAQIWSPVGMDLIGLLNEIVPCGT